MDELTRQTTEGLGSDSPDDGGCAEPVWPAVSRRAVSAGAVEAGQGVTGVAQITRSGLVVACNRDFLRLLGISRELASGESVLALALGWPDAARARLQGVIESPEKAACIEVAVAGRVVMLEVVPVRAPLADDAGFVLIAREWTAQPGAGVGVSAARESAAELEARIVQLELDARAMTHFQQSEPPSLIEPFRKTQPAAYCAALEQYQGLLKDALREQDYRLDHQVSERVRSLAMKLAAFAVGPRDVIELHSTVLRQIISPRRLNRDAAYLEAGRLLLLELMGELLAQYRQQAGVRSVPESAGGAASNTLHSPPASERSGRPS